MLAILNKDTNVIPSKTEVDFFASFLKCLYLNNGRRQLLHVLQLEALGDKIR